MSDLHPLKLTVIWQCRTFARSNWPLFNSAGREVPGGRVAGPDEGGAEPAEQQQPWRGLAGGAAEDAVSVAALLPAQHPADALHQGLVPLPRLPRPDRAGHRDLHRGLLHFLWVGWGEWVGYGGGGGWGGGVFLCVGICQFICCFLPTLSFSFVTFAFFNNCSLSFKIRAIFCVLWCG